ncbi:MAG: hypothetical protein ACPLZ9_01530 [Candidatus Ratteibacteria bacterium]
MDIAKTDSQSVKADAIFCGDKGIVIILRNGDYRTIFDKEKNEWITNFEKPEKIKIFVTLPLWFSYQIETIESIVDGDILPFKKDYRKIIIEKEMIEIAEPILIKFKKEAK